MNTEREIKLLAEEMNQISEALIGYREGSFEQIMGAIKALKDELSPRDFFAAAALQGFRANPNGNYTTYANAAEEAFKYADAMLQRRNE